MELKRKEPGVAAEIIVGGEDGPLALQGHGADKEVGWRTRDAPGATKIRHARSFFVVFNRQRRVLEGPQSSSQSLVLSLAADSGKKFLTDRSD
jgi:hypothetical protein